MLHNLKDQQTFSDPRGCVKLFFGGVSMWKVPLEFEGALPSKPKLLRRSKRTVKTPLIPKVKSSQKTTKPWVIFTDLFSVNLLLYNYVQANYHITVYT